MKLPPNSYRKKISDYERLLNKLIEMYGINKTLGQVKEDLKLKRSMLY